MMKEYYIFLKYFALIYLVGGLMQPVIAHAGADTNALFIEAKRLINSGSYEQASTVLKDLISEDPRQFLYTYELGKLFNQRLDDKLQSIPYLEEAKKYREAEKHPEIDFYLGLAYDATNDDKKARAYLQAFISRQPTSPEAENARSILATYKEEEESQIPELIYNVLNLGKDINSEFSDYIPVVNEDEDLMLYTSRRNTNVGNKVDKDDNQYFEDMYFARGKDGVFKTGTQFTAADPLVRNLTNTNAHESPVWMTYDETQLIIYKDNKLWKADIINDTIQAAELLPKTINRSSYQPHASLTEDGKVMYFSSEDKSETREGLNLNIYRSELQDNGKWGKAKKVEVINTEYDEDSPVISKDGTVMYFASKGHNSFGGYDIFVSKFVDSTWTTPKNLGQPLNSGGDDLYYQPNASGTNAYLASNRLGGFGDMDIYKIEYFDQAFENCIAIEDQSYVVSINASSSVDTLGPKLLYNWSTGDGGTAEGLVFEYGYEMPGEYDLTLSITDSLTGIQIEEGPVKKIVVDNVNYIGFEGPDTVSSGGLFALDASVSRMKDGEITTYLWQLGSKVKTGESTILHTFDYPGEYNVALQVLKKGDARDESNNYCVNKKIVVLDDAAWTAYLNDRRLKTQLSGVLNENDRVLSLENMVADNAGKSSDQLSGGTTGEENQTVQANTAKAITPKDSIVAGNTIAATSQVDSLKTIAGTMDSVSVVPSDSATGNVAQNATSEGSLAAKTSTSSKEGEDETDSVSTSSATLASSQSGSEAKTGTSEAVSSTGVESELAQGSSIENRKTSPSGAAGSSGTSITTRVHGDPNSEEQKEKSNIDDVDPKLLSGLDLDNVPDFELKPVYFDFDKSNINEKALKVLQENLAILNEYPGVVIQITGHTDSRGSFAYNDQLSERRARAVIQYFLNNGIEKDRILAVLSYGEKQLTNDCGDGVWCSTAQHQANRRAEIKPIGTKKK